jgi:mannose-6-phosphate isomerase-like protein (cupin superfamily)
VVQTGAGWFVNGDARHRFGPGDFLFVPAGVEHRFEEFSEDLAVLHPGCHAALPRIKTPVLARPP